MVSSRNSASFLTFNCLFVEMCYTNKTALPSCSCWAEWIIKCPGTSIRVTASHPPFILQLWDPSPLHSPGLVVLCRLPLLQNGDLGLGFPCPSLLEEEVEEEDDILLAVPLLLLESELRSGQQRENGALTLKRCLMVGQRGGTAHTGEGDDPLQSWLLPLAGSRSAGMPHSDELKGGPRLTRPLMGAIRLGCPGNQGMNLL